MLETAAANKYAEEQRKTGARLWPIDKLILTYVIATGLLVLVFSPRIPEAGWLLALHTAAAILACLAARRSISQAIWIFRHWYPVFYVPAFYEEMRILIPAIRGTDLDLTLARLDLAIWRVYPTIWLECVQNPLLVEFLQIVYSLFVPAILLVAVLFWRRQPLTEFRYHAFLMTLGFLACYIGYLLVPARGPRYAINHLQHTALHGLWVFRPLQNTLDLLEGTHYDCFPSGHTALTIMAWWSCRRISTRLFFVFSVFAVCQILSTVYLRYHYTADLLAGAALALILLVTTPYFYAFLENAKSGS